MRTPRVLLPCVALLSSLGLLPLGSAAQTVIYNVDFDADAVGVPPTLADSNDPIPRASPTLISTFEGSAVTVVAAGGGLANQPVELSATDTDPLTLPFGSATLGFGDLDNATGGNPLPSIWVARFDVSLQRDAGFQQFRAFFANPTAQGIEFDASGQINSVVGTSLTQIGNYVDGVPTRVVLVFDLIRNTLSIRINGTRVSEDTLVAPQPPASFTMFPGSSDTAISRVFVDNVNIGSGIASVPALRGWDGQATLAAFLVIAAMLHARRRGKVGSARRLAHLAE